MGSTAPGMMHLTWTCVSDSTFDAYGSASASTSSEPLDPNEALALLEGLLDRRTGELGEAEESSSREAPFGLLGLANSEASTVERLPLPPRRAEAFLEQVLSLYE